MSMIYENGKFYYNMNFLEYWQYHTQKYYQKPISDKGTSHDYIKCYYLDEFSSIRDSDITLVEIGIYDGFSLILWREWFTKAKIFGIEVDTNRKLPFELDVTTIYKDAYNIDTINMFENESIDYLIDDGPHTLQSQLDCIEFWFDKIKKNGKIIIEDILKIEYIDQFKDMIKQKNLNVECRVLDLRKNKNRIDDIIFEIKKL